MAFEKCKELYSALDNASDFIEHSRTKGAYNVKPIKGIRLANGRYLYNDPDKAVPSNPDEWGKGEDAEGIDEYGAYRLSENGEKIYDIGDGIDYDYTDGYFIPRNKPGAPPKKWDDAIGAYVPVSWEREEEVYPDIGEEKKEETVVTEEPVKETTVKEKVVKEEPKKEVTISEERTSEPKLPVTKKESTGEKFKRNLSDLWNKVKNYVSSMWERIRNKIRHGEMLDDEEYEFLAHNGIESEEDFIAMVENVDDDDFLEHYGIKEQRWGVRRGPPYPLKENQHSLPEKGAQYVKERKTDKLDTFMNVASKVATGAKTAADVYSVLNPPKKFDESTFDKELPGLDETVDDIARKIDDGIPLTQNEINAMNVRQNKINSFNKNYKSAEEIGRQKTLNTLQSIGGLAITALTLAKGIKEIRRSS